MRDAQKDIWSTTDSILTFTTKRFHAHNSTLSYQCTALVANAVAITTCVRVKTDHTLIDPLTDLRVQLARLALFIGYRRESDVVQVIVGLVLLEGM